MNIAIIGASGFLGTQLVDHLLTDTNNTIRAISRNASRMKIKPEFANRLKTINADIMDVDEIASSIQGTDVVYYLVHLMGHENKDFYTEEARAANNFSAAALAVGVPRVIYMGGLGDDSDKLSLHLASRHNSGKILREKLPLMLEFRASMIVGNGSVAFDIMRSLVKRMPLMTLPRWSISRTQPIALADAMEYLIQAATIPLEQSQIIEIGGPEILTYKELYGRYARWTGRNPLIVRVPFLPEWLGGLVLNFFTPTIHAKIGRVMVNSMRNDMIVTASDAQLLFPNITPRSIEEAFAEAKKVETVK
jgi:uncharacterized protein YbjT (DUF2867 family)